MKNLLTISTLLLAAIVFTSCEKEEDQTEPNYTYPTTIMSIQAHTDVLAWDFRVDTFSLASFVTIKTQAMLEEVEGGDASYCLPLAYIDSFPDGIFDLSELPQSIKDSLGYQEKWTGPLWDRSGRPDTIAYHLYNN